METGPSSRTPHSQEPSPSEKQNELPKNELQEVLVEQQEQRQNSPSPLWERGENTMKQFEGVSRKVLTGVFAASHAPGYALEKVADSRARAVERVREAERKFLKKLLDELDQETKRREERWEARKKQWTAHLKRLDDAVFGPIRRRKEYQTYMAQVEARHAEAIRLEGERARERQRNGENLLQSVEADPEGALGASVEILSKRRDELRDRRAKAEEGKRNAQQQRVDIEALKVRFPDVLAGLKKFEEKRPSNSNEKPLAA